MVCKKIFAVSVAVAALLAAVAVLTHALTGKAFLLF